MALPLKYNTASQTIILGPFLDDTDGKTRKTALSIANTDIKLAKHNATSFTNKNSGGATHISNGYYYCTLDGTDTDTLGRLFVAVDMSGALPVWHEFEVMSQQEYDAKYGSGYASVNVVQVAGTTQTARDLGANLDTTVSSRAPASTALSNTTWTDTKAGYLDVAISSRSTLTAADVWGYTTRTLSSFGTLVSDIWSYSTRTLSEFSTSLAVSIWNVLESAITTASSIGLKVKTNLDTTVSSRSTLTADAAADAVWDEALGGHLASGSTGAALNAAGSAGDPWSTSLPGAYGSGTAGYILGNRLDATVSSRAAESGGNVAAIKAKTDQLTFSGSDVVATLAGESVTVGTNNDKTGYSLATAPPTAGEIADAVWDEALSGHSTTGSAGEAQRKLDATVSSRSTLTAADVWGYASGVGVSILTLIVRACRAIINKMTVNESTGAVSLKDEAGTTEVATGSVTSASGVTTRDKLTWL